MKHVETIRAFIQTLMKSESFHALVVQSPPGWGKSTTIDQALSDLKITAVAVGSYATPLHIYNTLCRSPDSVIVLDDCAGLFSDPKAMAILKAATWHSGGLSESDARVRRVAWGSTSEKVEHSDADFSGKLILLTNVVPTGKETEAFLSRCLSYRISISDADAKQMLLSAAGSASHFSDPKLAQEVAQFLTDGLNGIDLQGLNLRTLKMGYELASTHSDGWRELLEQLVPRTKKSNDRVAQILMSGLPAKEQEARFLAVTGKSRRTYYNLKRRLNLTRSYRSGGV